jgi:hypothetical protein
MILTALSKGVNSNMVDRELLAKLSGFTGS